jgi:Putative collagen-binding domain of a collagenase
MRRDRHSGRFMKTASLAALCLPFGAPSQEPMAKHRPAESRVKDLVARGLLRVHPKNPRYFTDGSGKAVYLTAAHTWANLQDIGFTDPPPAFDYATYLDFLQKHHHNFIRLWRWELCRWQESRDNKVRYCAPHPWKRTGPEKALDGKPKFDLHQFDPEYFDRLRTRAKAAGERGIYVSVMLFEGWGLTFASWDGHPFNVKNNVQGINGDLDGDGKGIETQTLKIPAITRIQEAYVRKVIDTVNDLDNVLFEVANESNFAHSKGWQYHLIRYVKTYERNKPKQHPVGMTGMAPTDNKVMTESPADWISLGADTSKESPYQRDPPAADGKKVSVLDTDHVFGVGGGRDWVWKSFLRGHNPIWMDPYEKDSVWEPLPATAEDVRRSLGETRRWAERVNLAAMTPQNDLASTKFCLANPGFEYLVYLPQGGTVTVDLSHAHGDFAVEWQNAATGKATKAGTVSGGARRQLKSPFAGDALLYLARESRE